MPLEKLGPYRLERVLGRGGMGAVYAGVKESGERAAVKVLAESLAEDPGFRDRFRIEIETLKKLRHPNIVQLDGYGEEDGHLFYVMELVEGTSLQDEILRGRRFGWREATRIGVQTARALKHAHDRGIVHRDLKPANLLIDKLDNVKLADFGIAKLFGANQLTVVGGVIGTADYMSPEQAEGKGVTGRSDLYSLGSVLYTLLTGRPPFAAKTVAEVLHGLRFDSAIPVRRLSPDTPEPLEAIIMQLLAKDPAERIPTAIATANRLQAMEHALSVETRIDLPFAENGGRAKPTGTRLSGPSDVTVDLPAESGDEYQLQANDPWGATAAPQPPKVPESPTTGRITLVPGDKARAAAARSIVQEPVPSAGPPTPRATTFTTVTEAERLLSEANVSGEDGISVWLKAAPLAALAIALLIVLYTLTRPPTADALFRKISAAAATGDVQQLVAVEPDITAFQERFPDDERNESLQPYLEDVERYRMERQFDVRARFRGSVDKLLPVERAYLDAIRLAPSEPDVALRKLDALIALFDEPTRNGGDIDELRTTRRCVDLAKKQADKLRESAERGLMEQKMYLRRRLEEIERQRERTPEARRALEGLLELYGDRPWAKELAEKAREMLEETSR